MAAAWSAQGQRFLSIERRLFEVLGGWVPTVPEPEAKLLLRAHSFQHAWHAELWEAVLPAGVGSAPDDGVVALLDGLEEPAGTVERLTGAYRVVLPALVAAYGRCRARTSPATDGPLLRALALMLADGVEAVGAGEALLEALRPAADRDDGAEVRRKRLEGLLQAADLG